MDTSEPNSVHSYFPFYLALIHCPHTLAYSASVLGGAQSLPLGLQSSALSRGLLFMSGSSDQFAVLLGTL